MNEEKTYRIFHHYDSGDRSIYITAKSDPTDASIYMQFRIEDLVDVSANVDNFGIGHGLIALYGCTPGSRTTDAIEIDLYSERAKRCGDKYRALMVNKELIRSDEELIENLSPYLESPFPLPKV